MRIRRAEALLIRLPMRLSVRHALAARQESLNLLVRLSDDQGREGWGEGVPREYVTGERAETSFEHLAGVLLPRLIGVSVEDPDCVLQTAAGHIAPAPGTQTCCCAAELALLDLAGKAFGRPADAWFGGPRRESVRYAAVLPLLPPAERATFLAAVRTLGFGHIKVKADGEHWQEALADARTALGGAVTIAVDANGSWGFDAAAGHLRRMEPYGVSWVEQPLARGREHEIPRLAGRSAIPLMADESLTTEAEALWLAREGGYRLFNLRLSKLGGLAASHRIARIAAANGVRVQVGCQVGESSLLSAAGRVLAATLPGLAALEGSYGKRLLESDVTARPCGFGPGGIAAVQQAPGLGVTVNPDLLKPLVIKSVVVG
jgi:muconate cycloisomerase